MAVDTLFLCFLEVMIYIFCQINNQTYILLRMDLILHLSKRTLRGMTEAKSAHTA